MLQESYGSASQERIWQSEWGNKCIFTHGNSNSRGVAILLSKRVASKIHDIERDVEGRYVSCSISTNENIFAISNIYAPNKDDVGFFNKLAKTIDEDVNVTHNIIGGDFNIVRDAKLDHNANVIYHEKCKESIDSMVEKQDLIDIWRVQNPEKKYFTYMKAKQKTSWAWLDYFLVSQSMHCRCKS